jgi:hypothetical protein
MLACSSLSRQYIEEMVYILEKNSIEGSHGSTTPCISVMSRGISKSPAKFPRGCYTKKEQLMYDFGGVHVKLDTVASACCSATELCPIWYEKFENVELEIAKGRSFLNKFPDVCIATLSCGHRFSLLGIMYQFVLLDTRCPLCRDGVHKKTNVKYIPYAFRKCMRIKLKDMKKQDEDEQTLQDAETARQLETSQERDAEWVSAISAMLSEESRVSMTVYMFAVSADGTHRRNIHFQNFEMIRVHGGMLFSLSARETRNIIDVLHNTASDSIRITIHSRTPDGVPIELANTPVIVASTFDTGTENMTFMMSSEEHLYESSVHLIMDEGGGLGHIQWQSV